MAPPSSISSQSGTPVTRSLTCPTGQTGIWNQSAAVTNYQTTTYTCTAPTGTSYSTSTTPWGTPASTQGPWVDTTNTCGSCTVASGATKTWSVPWTMVTCGPAPYAGPTTVANGAYAYWGITTPAPTPTYPNEVIYGVAYYLCTNGILSTSANIDSPPNYPGTGPGSTCQRSPLGTCGGSPCP